jgi:hypothetical protein
MKIHHNTHTGQNDSAGFSPAPEHPRGRKRAKRTRAQSLMEFALAAPLLLLIVFGIIDIARLVQARVSVSNAARSAVRYAVTGQQDRDPGTGQWITRTITIRNKGIAGLTGLPLSSTLDRSEAGFHDVEINPRDAGQPHQIVEITVFYNVHMLTPLVNAILPFVLVRGYERAINEEWGPVQSFDHANIPPTPRPLPTWTPYLSPTPSRTPTKTMSPTLTRTPTITNTPTATGTPTNSYTPSPTITATGTITRTPTRTPLGAPTGTRTNTPTITRTFTITPTPTRTGTPTITPTFTNTATPTVTGTFTRTNTPLRTSTITPTLPRTSTPTITRTPTPARALVIAQVVGRKPNGSNQPLDIQVTVRDDLGATVDGATVAVTASGSSTWSGTLSGVGGGVYRACNVGSFNGSGGGGISISVTASKSGYTPGSGSGSATNGNIGSCP